MNLFAMRVSAKPKTSAPKIVIQTASCHSDAVTVSLHTYGMHVNHTGRSQYDAEKNLEIPFVVTEQ